MLKVQVLNLHKYTYVNYKDISYASFTGLLYIINVESVRIYM